MKFFIYLLLLIPVFSFSQDENLRGTIHVKKADSTVGVIIDNDGPCRATVLDYWGENTVKRKDILGIKKVELNKECGYKIISFTVSCLNDNETIRYAATSDTFESDILTRMKDVSFIKFSRIKGKRVDSDQEREFPPIIFKIKD